MKIVKNRVSKPVFWTFSILFHCLCLSGLTWQLTQVSVTYFRYEVISDIKVIMPENDDFKKYLNFCYYARDAIRFEKYEHYLAKYGVEKGMDIEDPNFKTGFITYNLSLEEQFDSVMIDGIKITADERGSFLVSETICHHLYSDKMVVYSENLSNNSVIYVTTSKDIEGFDK